LILNSLQDENNEFTVEWFEKKYKIKIFNNNEGVKKLSGYKD
jgi:hypothetical protein